jgi:hypothetical protein
MNVGSTEKFIGGVSVVDSVQMKVVAIRMSCEIDWVTQIGSNKNKTGCKRTKYVELLLTSERKHRTTKQ